MAIENIGSREPAEGNEVGPADTGILVGRDVGTNNGCELATIGRGRVYGGDRVIDLLETAPVALHFDAKQIEWNTELNDTPDTLERSTFEMIP